jgi:hypothetical protein
MSNEESAMRGSLVAERMPRPGVVAVFPVSRTRADPGKRLQAIPNRPHYHGRISI